MRLIGVGLVFSQVKKSKKSDDFKIQESLRAPGGNKKEDREGLKSNKKELGRIHGLPVADEWAGVVKLKPAHISSAPKKMKLRK